LIQPPSTKWGRRGRTGKREEGGKGEGDGEAEEKRKANGGIFMVINWDIR
jgi:hypothetical protein